MDTAYANALKLKEDLHKQLAEVETFLRLYQRFSGTFVEQDETLTRTQVPANGAMHSEVVHNPLRARRRANPSEYADMAARIISDEGRPMSRTELAEAFAKRDVMLPSDDKPRYLGTILWRNSARFRNLPELGYWLKDKPWPAAGYDPDTDTAMAVVLDTNLDDVAPPEGETEAPESTVFD